MNSASNKLTEYRELVSERKGCRRCRELQNPGSEKLRRWDSDHLGPWSQWLHDLNAELMVVGQEWADANAYRQCKGKDNSRNATNRHLKMLLEEAGFIVPLVEEGSSESRVFLTNAVLCLKNAGGMQGPVQSQWFENCGGAFLKPLLELVRPKIVVTLGERAYTAVLNSYHIPRQRSFRSAVEGLPIPLFAGCRLAPVYHPGNRIWNTWRKKPEQMHDWERVKQALSSED
jgi:uracil-DNA glycosylase family 4